MRHGFSALKNLGFTTSHGLFKYDTKVGSQPAISSGGIDMSNRDTGALPSSKTKRSTLFTWTGRCQRYNSAISLIFNMQTGVEGSLWGRKPFRKTPAEHACPASLDPRDMYDRPAVGI